MFTAAIEHRNTEGQTAELQKHFKLGANQIPLALMRAEERATTPAPGDVGQNQSEVIPGVFPQACATFVGIDMPTVGVGEHVFPVLTTNAVVGTPAEGTVATGTGLGTLGETTGSFSAEVLDAVEIAGRVFLQPERTGRGSPAWTPACG